MASSLILEDGTGVLLADSYVAASDVLVYATAHGASFDLTGDVAADAAIRRATQFIDSYRNRFPGYRSHRRLQGLEWPRIGAFTYLSSAGRGDLSYRGVDFDPGYAYILNNEIPIEVKKASYEAAIRELADPNSMQPDLERGGQIERLKAGSVEIQYGANARALTTWTVIEGLLSGLLMAGNAGGVSGVLMRG